MKFILFVEGRTEKAVPPFLKRWLDVRLTQPVGIKAVLFNGWSELWRDTPKKARLYLAGPDKNDIVSVVSLLDLYGPTFYPPDKVTVQERYEWAKLDSEQRVDHPRFRQFFAVHETEAWLLSQPEIFPIAIRNAFPSKTVPPEKVNFQLPPAKLLDELYNSQFTRKYNKVSGGAELFQKLDPNVAYAKCPYLKLLMDEMLQLARVAGL